MKTEQIKTFLAVYRAGDFISVAKERNVAPSSITRSVAALEATLKTQLFQRSTRSLRPTEAGDNYYRLMGPIMEEFDHAHDKLREDDLGPSGHLRVTASVSYGQIVIAPRLKKFRERYPNIELDLILSDGRIDLISEQIDVAIRHGRLPDSSLTARKLTDVTYKLVASPDYLSQNSKISSPESLKAHELITFGYEDFRDEWHFIKNDVQQAIAITPAIKISNAVAIRQCVRDGVGVALLADWTVEDDIKSKKLVRLLPLWTASGSTKDTAIWLVYPSSRYTPAKSKAFIDFMLSER